ncbi:MAG: hypothetical protein JW818_18160 [Pirellulales bacterium]|nr:hypothetical protein [Pirellulales bacterium]
MSDDDRIKAEGPQEPQEQEVQQETAEQLAPDGPPQPVKEGGKAVSKTLNVGAAVVIGGFVFMCLGVVFQSCPGATRSTRLEWERRDAEIQKAWERDQVPLEQSSPAPDSAGESSGE